MLVELDVEEMQLINDLIGNAHVGQNEKRAQSCIVEKIEAMLDVEMPEDLEIVQDLRILMTMNDPSVPFNKERIDAVRRFLNEQMCVVASLEKANQAICKHPKEHHTVELISNTDGFTVCKRCGASW